MLLLLNLKKTLYLILIIKSFKNLSNITFIIKNIIISKRNAINSQIKIIKTILMILITMTTKKMMIIIIIITMIINSKTIKIIIEKMINLTTKSVITKIEILSNLLTIKEKS